MSLPTTSRPGIHLWTLAVGLAALVEACNRGPTTVVLSGQTMGTTYVVKVVLPGGVSYDNKYLTDLIQKPLDEVNARMSTFREDSELSRFNQFLDTTPFAVSKETAEVFAMAQRVSQASDGAFDVTGGPLVNAWGFGPPGRATQTPTEEELERLRRRVGYRLLEVNAEEGALRKARPDIYCDLSAIAKGYGVDKVAEALERAGFTDYMVEIGGEVRARGLNPTGQPWRIAIEKPVPYVRGEIDTVVPLRDCSLATSGDYRNFYEENGKRLSHTIDPGTGRPITHQLASVSVIHKECAMADAYATAIMVLGPEEGLAFAEREGLAAVFLVHAGQGGFTRTATLHFEEYMASAAAAIEKGAQ